jgi:hypothetical protein
MKGILLFFKTPRPLLEPIFLFNGYWGSFPEVRRPVSEELPSIEFDIF